MKHSRWPLYLAALAAAPLFLLLESFSAAPLPEPPAFPGDLPIATPPREMAIHHLPTGATHRSAAFGYRGGSFFDEREFSMSAVLVTHPKGDLLIDSGFGSGIDEQFQSMPLLFRMGTRYEKGTPAAAQLARAGYDPRRLRCILLTHGHWDHVSGIRDFPNVPVLVTAEEHRFIEGGSPWTAVARSLGDVRYEEYGLEERPFLGFPRSRDFYGDGSIVIVSAPGHTPGSVIVFLALPGGRRYALIGDLVWQREGIAEREERPWLLRTNADSEPEQVRENILRMAAIAERFPELTIVPAHDARGMAEIPRL